MADKDTENKDNVDPMIPKKSDFEEFDTAGKSLSDALRISFIVLKVIMIVLVIAFLASGFETVGTGEQALVLRFGKIQKVLGEGPHWIWPYPIDEIVKIPVETIVNLPVNSFWYYESASDVASEEPPQFGQDDPYNPLQHGYCLTRGSRENETVLLNEEILEEAGLESQSGQEEEFLGFEGNDYNIAHTRWQLFYQIDNPEYFFRHIQIRDAKPGELYADVIKSEVRPLLKSMLESAVVTTMVHFTIDEVITIRDTISNNVKRILQQELEKIDSGIKVVSVQITESIYPPQVKEAFEASTKASQNRSQKITEARTYYSETLTNTAGQVAEDLYRALLNPDTTDQDIERLWSGVTGEAREIITEAQIYRTEVVENAKADASYLQSILPEYRLRPELVRQQIYNDATTEILENAEDVYLIQGIEGSKGNEIRVRLDKGIKRQSDTEEDTEDN